MLKGIEFGMAIKKAIEMKILSGAARSKAEIARHFGVKPPSIADWEKKGSVSKDKLPELWRYFSDVVGPAHWGMRESEWPAGLTSEAENRGAQVTASAKDWPFPKIDESKVRRLSDEDRASVQTAILIAAAQVGIDIKKFD